MYSVESLNKYYAMARECLDYYLALDPAEFAKIHVVISNGNRKIGRVKNVSLLPILTCVNCSGCQSICYDIKACLQYPGNVLEARAKNTAILMRDTGRFFNEIAAKLSRCRKNKYFRFHVAGDIRDYAHFEKMVDLAKQFPDWHFGPTQKTITSFPPMSSATAAIVSLLSRKTFP